MQRRVWCARQDLNLHTFRHYHLKDLFLPDSLAFLVAVGVGGGVVAVQGCFSFSVPA